MPSAREPAVLAAPEGLRAEEDLPLRAHEIRAYIRDEPLVMLRDPVERLTIVPRCGQIREHLVGDLGDLYAESGQT